MNGKTALITGGSEGIGLACAKKLYDQGYAVCLLSRSPEKLEAAAGKLTGGSQEADSHILLIPCDVTQKSQAARAVGRMAEKWGRIDVLINSAGCSMHAPSSFEDVDQEEYTRILRTNTDGTFWTTQAVLPLMKQREKGFILNILSTAAHAAGAGNAPYSASKFAAKALTDTLVQEYRGTDIRISSISPGPVSTTIWSHKTTPPEKALMMKMLRPQDIADIAAFLLALPDHVHIRDLEVTPWKMA